MKSNSGDADGSLASVSVLEESEHLVIELGVGSPGKESVELDEEVVVEVGALGVSLLLGLHSAAGDVVFSLKSKLY